MKDPEVFLRHMLDAAERIENYTDDITKGEFKEDDLLQDGVIRQFEILGEASKRVPDDVKEEHPEVPWSDIAGMRDKLIHGYFSVDIDVVWKTVRKDLPPLRAELESIVDELYRIRHSPSLLTSRRTPPRRLRVNSRFPGWMPRFLCSSRNLPV